MDQPILGRLFTNIVDIYDNMRIHEFIEVMDEKYSPTDFSNCMTFDFKRNQKVRGWYVTQGDTVVRAEYFKGHPFCLPDGGSITVKGLHIIKG